jgi:hypothetical protein
MLPVVGMQPLPKTTASRYVGLQLQTILQTHLSIALEQFVRRSRSLAVSAALIKTQPVVLGE